MTITSISPQELFDLRKSGKTIELIDVRTPAEYRSVHAEGATLMPLQDLDPKLLLSQRAGSDAPLYVICQGGGRSQQACERLAAAGVSNVVNVAGGTNAWVAAGLPVEKAATQGASCPFITVDRQMRIVAGSMVTAGVALGFTVNPNFHLLAGFVGCGLIFAGITNICPMIGLLSRMPWNR